MRKRGRDRMYYSNKAWHCRVDIFHSDGMWIRTEVVDMESYTDIDNEPYPAPGTSCSLLGRRRWSMNKILEAMDRSSGPSLDCTWVGASATTMIRMGYTLVCIHPYTKQQEPLLFNLATVAKLPWWITVSEQHSRTKDRS